MGGYEESEYYQTLLIDLTLIFDCLQVFIS
jgi:hypothetical protein